MPMIKAPLRCVATRVAGLGLKAIFINAIQRIILNLQI